MTYIKLLSWFTKYPLRKTETECTSNLLKLCIEISPFFLYQISALGLIEPAKFIICIFLAAEPHLEYIGFPEWLRMKKCFFLFLHEIEASSCTSFINQTGHDIPFILLKVFSESAEKNKWRLYAMELWNKTCHRMLCIA